MEGKNGRLLLPYAGHREEVAHYEQT